MGLPNFIIIGAARSGTTSLYHYLRQHPDIAMSKIKETRYFAWEVEQDGARDLPKEVLNRSYPVQSFDAYRQQFRHADQALAIGEASPRYLYIPGVPQAIAARLPEVRLIAILREPGRRAWAHFMVFSRIGWDQRSFEQAIEDEISALAEPPQPGKRPYLLPGFYHRHLRRFLDVFPRENLLVLLHDDLATNTASTIKTILGFLGVDDNVPLDLSKRYGGAGVARNKTLEGLMTNPATRMIERNLPRPILRTVHRFTKPVRAKNVTRLEMPAAARDRLRSVFQDDIEALETLLDRDLSAWRA